MSERIRKDKKQNHQSTKTYQCELLHRDQKIKIKNKKRNVNDRDVVAIAHNKQQQQKHNKIAKHFHGRWKI